MKPAWRRGAALGVVTAAMLATAAAAQAAPSTRTIFLRPCPAEGCAIASGPDDSRLDRSSLADGPRTIGPFGHASTAWAKILRCVQETYLPFEVTITDVDPGATPHHECVVGGQGAELAPALTDAGGAAPATCAELPDAMTFVFDVWGEDVDRWCQAIAQQTARALGLEIELALADPLTLLPGGPLPKRFQNVEAPCGELQARPCGCGRPSQNSFQRLLALYGARPPTPPGVTIDAPRAGGDVQPGFTVRSTFVDDLPIVRAELVIDGAVVATTPTAPFTLRAPPSLSFGPHTLVVRAYDLAETQGTGRIEVVAGPRCVDGDGTCAGDEACVAGRCVLGPGTRGGLGEPCTDGEECASGTCAQRRSGETACVEQCTPAHEHECPSDFACLAIGLAGVCFPHDGDAGCCAAGGAPTSAMFLAFVTAALLRLRRRPT